MDHEQMIKAVLEYKKILIIDDEEKIREIIQSYLKKTDAEISNIIHAGDGREARRKLANQEFDLIIMDIVMPHWTGLEILEELKASSKTKNIPVLMVSGKLEPHTVKEAITNGARHILAKPFNYKAFIERVCGCLEQAKTV